MNIEVLEDELKKIGFTYPDSFMKVVNLKLLNFDLWYIMDEEKVLGYLKDFSEKYPERSLVPFAQKGKDGVIACFGAGKGDKIEVVNVSGTEDIKAKSEYADFWEWLEDAIREMINLNRG